MVKFRTYTVFCENFLVELFQILYLSLSIFSILEKYKEAIFRHRKKSLEFVQRVKIIRIRTQALWRQKNIEQTRFLAVIFSLFLRIGQILLLSSTVIVFVLLCMCIFYVHKHTTYSPILIPLSTVHSNTTHFHCKINLCSIVSESAPFLNFQIGLEGGD